MSCGTYWFTPRSRVLLEKLTSLQLVKKFPAFYGTRRFITEFTSARHPSLSWATSIQFIPRHPTTWRSIYLLFSHLCLCLPSGSFPQLSPPKPCTRLSPHPYALHAPPISLSCGTFFFLWRCDPTRVMVSSFFRFLDHTQRRITVRRTPLDEWSARRIDL